MRLHPVLVTSLLAACVPGGPPDKPAAEDAAPSAAVVAITPANPTTTDDLVVTVVTPSADPDGDDVTYTYDWYRDGAPVAGPGATVGADLTTRDEVWTVEVVASDGVLDSDVATAAVTIADAPPGLAIRLDPASPGPDDDLVVTSTPDDADGDPVTLAYAWTVDGVATAETGDTIPASATTQGQTWAVTVTPSDGSVGGTPATASVVIGDHAPVVTTVTLSPAEVREADTITAIAAVEDADGDPLSLTYAWYVDGVPVADADGDTLDGASFDRDQAVWVVVTVYDGYIASEPVTSDVRTVLDTAPTVTRADVEPATVYHGDTITCAPSGWADADGDAEGYRYAWTVDGGTVGTDPTLDTSAFAHGTTLVCAVTPTDGTLDGDPATGSVVIADSPPALGSVSLCDLTPTEGDVVSVSLSTPTDADGDAVSVSIAWYVNGTFVTTADTLDGAWFDKGDTIRAAATPTDDAGTSGPAVWSDTAVVVDTAPVITRVTLSPASPGRGDTLVPAVTATDADGDAVTVTYAWYVDGVLLPDTGPSLAGRFERGQQVYVVVVPDDGEETGSAVASDVVTIGNTAPGAPGVTITPAEPAEGVDDLRCAVTPGTDTDGDPLAYAVSWTVDGEAYADAITTTLPGDTVPARDTDGEQVWTCTVTADDGEGGATSASASTTVCSLLPWYPDADRDGYGAAGGVVVAACERPVGYVATNDDCDDADASISPGAAEVCDDVDNDCDGAIDDDDPSVLGETWYTDDDGDGYGSTTPWVGGCSPPSGYADNADDCDDAHAEANPGEVEVADALDNDCDGVYRTDTACTGYDVPGDYSTISAALAAHPTGTICIGEGTFAETVTAEYTSVLQGVSPDKTIITGRVTLRYAATASNIRFAGGVLMQGEATSRTVTLRDSVVTGHYAGYYVEADNLHPYSASTIMIQRVEVIGDGSANTAISLYMAGGSSTSGPTIRVESCYLHDVHDGIFAHGPYNKSTFQLYGNTIIDVDDNGIQIVQSSTGVPSFTVANNVITGARYALQEDGTPASVTLANNALYDNTTNYRTMSAGSSDLLVDPLLDDTTYPPSPGAGSPLIGAANTSYSASGGDFWGNSGATIGAVDP